MLRVDMETREVTFTDTSETRQVPITHWVPAKLSQESGQQGIYDPPEPNWPKVLPGYLVEGRAGGYRARKDG